MCGIAGFLLAPGDRVDTARLTRALHAGIDPRGGDATGAAWFDASGSVHHFTVVGRAREFRSAHPNAAARARMAVLHTRFATQGSVNNALNNHPVRSGHFLGVHNGHILNDDELFRTLPIPRAGEVDSEAAVALIRYASMKGEDAWTALERLEGGAALAWMDDRDPETLHLARASRSPLFVGQTASGTVMFASTYSALYNAAKAVGLDLPFTQELKEGTYMRFFRGRLVEVQSFTPNEGRSWYSYYTGHGGWGQAYTTRTKGKGSRYGRGASDPYARDEFESKVLGYPKPPKRKALKGAKSARESAKTLALVPYDDSVYRLAFSEPKDTDPDEVEQSRPTRIHDMTDEQWSWDNEDMLHIALKAVTLDACAICGGRMDSDPMDDDFCNRCVQEMEEIDPDAKPIHDGVEVEA